jgi:thiol-disulfide isomerase/thioredoxin
MHAWPRMLILLLVWGCLGCSPGSERSPEAEVPGRGAGANRTTPADPTPAPEGQMEEEPPGAEVTLQILDWESALGLVEQHRGKVVVVDVWATYCPPCIAEFPHLVQLHREQGERVSCISISLDHDGLDDEPVDAKRDKVLAFLEKQGATFENVLCSTIADDVFSKHISSIPVVYVYDPEGNLAGQFPDPEDPGEFTYQEHVLPLVQKLLPAE